MMGVTVLESYTAAHSTALGVVAAVTSAVCFIGAIILFVWQFFDKETFDKSDRWIAIVYSVLVLFLMAIWASVSVWAFTPHHYEKVKVDPSTNYWEFNQRYEIVEQEGDIYTVMLREATNDGE